MSQEHSAHFQRAHVPHVNLHSISDDGEDCRIRGESASSVRGTGYISPSHNTLYCQIPDHQLIWISHGKDLAFR